MLIYTAFQYFIETNFELLNFRMPLGACLLMPKLVVLCNLEKGHFDLEIT